MKLRCDGGRFKNGKPCSYELLVRDVANTILQAQRVGGFTCPACKTPFRKLKLLMKKAPA